MLRYIATIFAKLYESWPVRISINAQDVTGVEFDIESLFDSVTSLPNEWTVCGELFIWLRDENYIQIEGFCGDVWSLGRTQLTHKAIEALKKAPDPLNPEQKKRSLIDAIVDSTKDSSKESRKQLINLAMTSLYNTVNQFSI